MNEVGTPFVLTKENYFSPEAQRIYLGSSSFKAWDMMNNGTEEFGNFIEGGCEAREMAIRKGLWTVDDKEVFMVGHYVHAWSEGPEAFKKFVNDNYSDIYQKSGKMYAPFIRADAMIETLKKSELVTMLRDTPQKETVMTGTIAGVPFKIMVDIPNFEKGYWADLKTTASIRKTSYKDGMRVSFIGSYDYKYQFAIYSEIIRQNLGLPEGEYLDPYLIAVDKQEVPDHEVIYMGKDFIDYTLETIKSRLPRIVAVRNGQVEPIRCEKCEYCRDTKQLKKPISLLDFEESLGLRMPSNE